MTAVVFFLPLLSYCLHTVMMAAEAKNAFLTFPTLDNPEVVLKRPPETVDETSPTFPTRRRKVLITVCVHGNEPCGWLALQNLAKKGYFGGDGDQKSFWSKHPGIESLTMILANPHATRANKRFVDHNLNRIFDGEEEGNGKAQQQSGYEHSLLDRMQKHIDESDWYIDIHSTSSHSEPFAIPLDTHPDRQSYPESQSVAECLPVRYVLEDLLESLDGTTMHWAGRDPDKIAVAVECGQHEAPSSIQTAEACIEEFVKLASFSSDEELARWPPEPFEKSIVLTCHDCQPVHHGFRYISGSTPQPFSHVEYNELIAVDDVVGEIRCHFKEGAYLIMPTAHSIVGEEAWFWGRPKWDKDTSSLHGQTNK